MEFSIGSQFSREFTFEDRLIVKDLEGALNKCLNEKSIILKWRKYTLV